mmetsp:Transcript_1607/g.3471  ORF Transcript_1607/g.3471 Transcript_1607/m.3471 type:complete len:204 (-) Transcript_1607:29-640(-)
MSVLYGGVCRAHVILADYSAYIDDFSETARKLISQSPASSVMKTYTQGHRVFSFFTEFDLTFICVSEQALSRETAYQFLKTLQQLFTPKYADKAALFATEIKKLVHSYSKENLHNVDPFAKVEYKLSSVVETTKSSIDKVIERQGKMSSLLQKTDDLTDGTAKLSRTARMIHRKVWKDKIRMYCGVCLLATTVIGIFVVWVLT